MKTSGVTVAMKETAAVAPALSSAMQCENCRIWEILEPDLFCGWCGKDIFQILAREEPIRVYLGTEPGQNDLRKVSTTIITNNSPNKISLACVEYPAWLLINPLQAVVEPYKTLDVNFMIDRKQLGGPQLIEGHFVFQPSASGSGNKSNFNQAKFEVQVWPIPELVLNSLTLYSSDPSSSVSLPGTVDADLKLIAGSFNPPIIAFGDTLPFELELGNFFLPVRLNFSQQVISKAHNVTYELQVEGLAKPLTGQFELDVRKPATLKIFDIEVGEESEKEIIAGTEEEVGLAIANHGEEELRIKKIEIESLGSHITVHPVAYPSILAPGTEASVTLAISAAASAPLRRHWFQVQIECNDGDISHCSQDLHISVTNDIHSDFVAVDFGTTDSAVASFDRKRRIPVNLNLERKNPDAKIYSNILFTSYFEDDRFEWLIGKEAKQRGHLFRNRFVKSIKTKAGVGYKETIFFQEVGQRRSFDLEAEEIIKFIIMDLLRLTHAALRRKPIKFILSVPTRFTLRQKAVLKDAFEKAAKARDLSLDPVEIIDESLAAGLFYILVGGPRDEHVKHKNTYSLMLLDFGGGTTDVTVFKVHQHLESGTDFKIDKVEIIGAWGDANLGGEGITYEIATVLAAKFLRQPVDALSDVREIRKLEDEAEAVKIAVSELHRFHDDQNQLDVERVVREAPDLLQKNLGYLVLKPQGIEDGVLRDYLRLYVENDRELDVWSDDFPRQNVGIEAQEVVDIFERRLEKFKGELAPLMRKIFEQSQGENQSGAEPGPEDFRVDILLLAGQSAQFPSVARVFQDLAKQPIDFVRDVDGKPLLKECVSRGSLYYISYLSGGLEFEITGRNRQWTRLGLIRPSVGRLPRFEELIPWGVQYPYESREFVLPRLIAVVGGNILHLEILENLTMSDDENRHIEDFEIFELELHDPSPERYTCKLIVDGVGVVTAFCKVGEDWIEMRAIS